MRCQNPCFSSRLYAGDDVGKRRVPDEINDFIAASGQGPADGAAVSPPAGNVGLVSGVAGFTGIHCRSGIIYERFCCLRVVFFWLHHGAFRHCEGRVLENRSGAAS